MVKIGLHSKRPKEDVCIYIYVFGQGIDGDSS